MILNSFCSFWDTKRLTTSLDVDRTLAGGLPRFTDFAVCRQGFSSGGLPWLAKAPVEFRRIMTGSGRTCRGCQNSQGVVIGGLRQVAFFLPLFAIQCCLVWLKLSFFFLFFSMHSLKFCLENKSGNGGKFHSCFPFQVRACSHLFVVFFCLSFLLHIIDFPVFAGQYLCFASCRLTFLLPLFF